MTPIKIFYEPETELLTVFWRSPRKNQICSELEDGVLLIKDSDTNEAIGIEILSYKPGEDWSDRVSIKLGDQEFIEAM